MTRTVHKTRCLLPGLWLAVASAILAPSAAAAQSSAEVSVAALKLGLNGRYKVGCWSEATVTLRGGTTPFTGWVQLVVADPDGVPTTVTSMKPVRVADAELATVRVNVRPGQTDGQVIVKLVSMEGKTVAQRTFYTGPQEGALPAALTSIDRIVGAYGPPVGLGAVVRAESINLQATASTVIAEVSSPADLPVHWYGYEGVETMILSTSDASGYRSLPADSAAIRALERWVELGGRLVLFSGKESAELIGPGGPLERFAPGKFLEMAPLRNAAPLETFAGAEERLGGGQLDLRAPRLENVAGEVLSYAGSSPEDLPLIIRTRRGLGHITFAGFDPNLAPFADWSGRVSLLRNLLGWSLGVVEEQAQSRAFTGQGFEDLAGQLRTALDVQFIGVRVVPFAFVAALIVGYILLIGPGDYFFVTRVLKRTELTWVTFPVLVAAVSVGAYYLAYRMKGDQLRVNQVELVDVALDENLVRGTLWTHYFSPEADRYDLRLTPRFANVPLSDQQTPLVSWLGMPGTGLGGMQGSAGQTTLFDRGYRFAQELDQMEGLPVQEWSTKTITGRWTAAFSAMPLEAMLRPDAEELVAGYITNRTGTDLSECVLLVGRWAYSLGQINDGATVKIDSERQPRSIKTQLTGSLVGQDPIPGATDNVAIFDPASSDVAGLTTLMMFYEAVGGRSYASAWNRYQHFVDMSSLLATGDAVLLARATDAAGSQWFDAEQPLVSDHDQNWTYYRFVIPVKQPREITVPAGP